MKLFQNWYIKIIIVYLFSIIMYLFYIHSFTIPVHIDVDEELYIAMAKSFHYTHTFQHSGCTLNYSCILYSMILSLAYYFYSPMNIMFLLRAIGVCIMLSSVFPCFLLSRQLLSNERHALYVTIFTVFLPSMMNTAYCMQETLSYPLFLWTCYAIYMEIETGRLQDLSARTIFIAILSCLCYFTKTYMIFLPICYCLLLLYEAISHKVSFIWKKLILYITVYALVFLLGKSFIYFTNNGVLGSNHYSTQFSNLFPLTARTLLCTISCIGCYLISLAFYWGVLPLILPLTNYKQYNSNLKRFIFFIFSCLFILIPELVISIVLTEEGTVIVPHKILYRYFEILEIPLLLIFLNAKDRLHLSPIVWKIYGLILGGLLGYYIYIGTNQRTAIMDAPVFLLMENITRYVVPHFNVIACICASMLIILTYLLIQKKKIKKPVNLFLILSGVIVSLFFMVNLWQLPYYTNTIANGYKIQQEAILTAQYYNNHKEEYDKVFYVVSENAPYAQALYAYFPIDIIDISSKTTIPDTSLNSLYIIWDETKQVYITSTSIPYH